VKECSPGQLESVTFAWDISGLQNVGIDLFIYPPDGGRIKMPKGFVKGPTRAFEVTFEGRTNPVVTFEICSQVKGVDRCP